MAAMTIRKISEEIASNIKKRAKANGRSAEAEARMALETVFGGREPKRTVADVIDDWKKRNGGGFDLPYMPRSKDPIEPADFG
jgi:plasmid stability protein